ncbi:MAG TPA: hypothetical protein ENJ95_07805 [Bacteroidetes bacterium]|nr:hypothetical protein [Bacteroidota bacterium]
MTLHLTDRQLEILVLMVYIGRYYMSIVENPETMNPEEGEIIHFEDKIYQFAHKSENCSHLVEPGGPAGSRLSVSLDMERRALDILHRADQDWLIGVLATSMARRDLNDKYGKTVVKEMENNDWTKYSRLMEVAMEPYEKEIGENGLDNLRFVPPEE